MEHPFFPLFVDLSEKNVLVVGAGHIASRRAAAILPFAGRVTVVAPEVSPSLGELADGGRIALEGTPKDVFAQTERVLALGLDVPEMMKLAHALAQKGIRLSEGLMTVNETALELSRRLKSPGRKPDCKREAALPARR